MNERTNKQTYRHAQSLYLMVEVTVLGLQILMIN